MPRTVVGTKEIHADWWAEGEVCVIRRLSYGRRQQMMARYIDVAGELTDPKIEITDDLISMMNLSIMEAAIVSMTDPDGKPMEVTPQVIFDLEGKDGDFIMDEINALNPELSRSKAAVKNFPSGRGNGAEDGEQPTD